MDTTMTPHVKAQWVRLLDVVAIGPLMTYGGLHLRDAGEEKLGNVLAVLGVLTVLYNGRNLLRVERARRAAAAQLPQPTSTHMLSPTGNVDPEQLAAAANAGPVHVGG